MNRNVAPPRGLVEAIAWLMADQGGVAGRKQLVAVGLSGSAIDARLRRRRLFSVHHGVYALTPALLPPRAAWRAALLAAGPRAVLSHRTAAAAWGLRNSLPEPPHVIVPGQGQTARR